LELGGERISEFEKVPVIEKVVLRAISLIPCFSGGGVENGLNVRTTSAVYSRAKTAQAVENAGPG
jgi:hypothetical protein